MSVGINSNARSGLTAAISVATGSSQGAAQAKTGLSIYFTVDISYSMWGSKLDQVLDSIREMLNKAPERARFIFRTFDQHVRTVVSKKKRYLDMDRLFQDLHRAGGSTALYDAWSQTLRQIPYEAYKTDRIYVLVFTDGEDNCSRNATLESVIEETQEFLKKPDVFFTFVQAGGETPSVQNLKQKYGKVPRCKILQVEDSANGIRFAFKQVREQMQQLRFQIQIAPTAEGIAGALQGLSITANLNPQATRGRGGGTLLYSLRGGLVPRGGRAQAIEHNNSNRGRGQARELTSSRGRGQPNEYGNNRGRGGVTGPPAHTIPPYYYY